MNSTPSAALDSRVSSGHDDLPSVPSGPPQIADRPRERSSTAGFPDPDTLPRAQQERRERIVLAALDFLEQREYDKIQVRDVAEHAGVAVSTVYRYFSSKEHLYAAVLGEWARSFKPRDPASADDDEPTSEAAQLLDLLHRAIRAFERSPQMLRAQVAIESTSDDNARALFYRFGFANHDVMSTAFHRADAARSQAIIETVNNVLATQLRYWALGVMPIEYVYGTIERTVGLIYPDEPTMQKP